MSDGIARGRAARIGLVLVTAALGAGASFAVGACGEDRGSVEVEGGTTGGGTESGTTGGGTESGTTPGATTTPEATGMTPEATGTTP